MAVEGVVLAAGNSARTAPECKLALKLGARTVLERSVAGMKPFCSRIYVVTGAHAEIVVGILNRQEGVTLVHNPDYSSGMYCSVKVGLRRTGAGEVFLLPGDCPFAALEVYEKLLAADGGIVLPTWQGRAGHPVLLRRPAIAALLCDNTCKTLRQFIAANHPGRVEVDCPGILNDIDTPEAYKLALRQMTGGEQDETHHGTGETV